MAYQAGWLPLLNGDCEFRTCDGEIHKIAGRWDMVVAFPPCTHLATSGARHFAKKRADGRQRDAIIFFCSMLSAKCSRIAVENPRGIMSGGAYIRQHFPDLAEQYSIPRPYSQELQPWYFAESEEDRENYHEKTTCLWLAGLPLIDIPAVHFPPPKKFVTSTGKSFPAWYSKSSLRGHGERSKVRSKTFSGIAQAMAEQWTPDLREVTT